MSGTEMTHYQIIRLGQSSLHKIQNLSQAMLVLSEIRRDVGGIDVKINDKLEPLMRDDRGVIARLMRKKTTIPVRELKEAVDFIAVFAMNERINLAKQQKRVEVIARYARDISQELEAHVNTLEEIMREGDDDRKIAARERSEIIRQSRTVVMNMELNISVMSTLVTGMREKMNVLLHDSVPAWDKMCEAMMRNEQERVDLEVFREAIESAKQAVAPQEVDEQSL